MCRVSEVGSTVPLSNSGMEDKSGSTPPHVMEESSSSSYDSVSDNSAESVTGRNVKKYYQRNSNRKRTAKILDSEDENRTRVHISGQPIGSTDTNDDGDEETPEEEEKRLRSNHQERMRMNRFNAALNSLRRCIPDQFRLGSRRLSKIRTLRLAISYIAALKDILEKDPQMASDVRQESVSASPVTYSGYGGIFPGIDPSSFDNFAETPSRLSLRDLAERGLSMPTNVYNTIACATPYRTPALTGRSSVGTPSGESSEDSFCSDNRVLGNSPDAFAASAYLRGDSQHRPMSTAAYLGGESPDVFSAASTFLRSHFVSGYSSPYGNSHATDIDYTFPGYSIYGENQHPKFRSATNFD